MGHNIQLPSELVSEQMSLASPWQSLPCLQPGEGGAVEPWAGLQFAAC